MTFAHFKDAVINGHRQFVLQTKTITYSNDNEFVGIGVIDSCLVSMAFCVGGFKKCRTDWWK